MSETLELKVKKGPLVDIFPLFDSSTLRHAHEIMTAMRTNTSLQREWFYTAEFLMYRVEDGEAVLYIAPREHNLIFRDIPNATSQLSTNQNYVPSKEGIEEVIAAAKTGAVLRVKLSDLRLRDGGHEELRRYLEIDTSNPDALNSTERAFAERIYGKGDEFYTNMKFLGAEHPGYNPIRAIEVPVLGPDYVKRQLKGKEDRAIARASGFGGIYYGAWFNARLKDINDPGGTLFGVLN